jgi:hypothetical protein
MPTEAHPPLIGTFLGKSIDLRQFHEFGLRPTVIKFDNPEVIQKTTSFKCSHGITLNKAAKGLPAK